MPNSKGNSRRSGFESEKNRRGKSMVKASSFHGKVAIREDFGLLRPKTVPDLFSSGRSFSGASRELTAPPRLTKLLMNVTVQSSVGAIQLVMHPEFTVGDLISDVVRQYIKEGRRPFLPSSDPGKFNLHYSQFCLESLERDEKLMTLGSRNFFLCTKQAVVVGLGGVTPPSPTTSCSEEAEHVRKIGFTWPKFLF